MIELVKIEDCGEYKTASLGDFIVFHFSSKADESAVKQQCVDVWDAIKGLKDNSFPVTAFHGERTTAGEIKKNVLALC